MVRKIINCYYSIYFRILYKNYCKNVKFTIEVNTFDYI